ECLDLLRAFDAHDASVQQVVRALMAYDALIETTREHEAAYTRTLEAAPWRSCDCGICEEAGIDVVMFRGSERNKRRGFHNLAVFRERLNRHLTPAQNKELVTT